MCGIYDSHVILLHYNMRGIIAIYNSHVILLYYNIHNNAHNNFDRSKCMSTLV